MRHKRQTPRSNQFRRGFTIVELLIVIVVIGILAAITFVAYNGIQQKARVAALQSDISNAASILEIAGVTDGAYPVDLTSAGLEASPGTTYQYTYTSSSNSYCLTGTNSNVTYTVSSANPTPTVGVCPPGVSTLAGSGTQGFADGTGASAQFYFPTGLAVDTSGTIYVADQYNHRIRTITPGGVVSTLAGSGTSGFADGTGTNAQFNFPAGVAVDPAGNIYVADATNHRIRKITASGVVTTLAGSGAYGFADGTGTNAQFRSPMGITVDASGTVYVADKDNHRIRKITSSGVVTTLAGSGTAGFADGSGASAEFDSPYGVTIDTSGTVYVADRLNDRIRTITPSGVVSTLAGSGTTGSADGTGTSAQFDGPFGITVDTSGTVYVGDSYNDNIRKITPSGVVTTLAGSGITGFADGTGTSAQFRYPTGVTVDTSGAVYVGDTGNNRIRKIE